MTAALVLPPFSRIPRTAVLPTAPRRVQLLALVFVGFLAADECLVDLDESRQDGRVITASLAEPLEHEPRRFLGHADLRGQLKTADTLAGRDQQIHGVEPLMERDVRPLEDGPRPHGEVALTGITAIEAALARRDALGLTTGGTDGPLGPTLAFHVSPRRFRVGEHLKKLEGRDRGFGH